MLEYISVLLFSMAVITPNKHGVKMTFKACWALHVVIKTMFGYALFVLVLDGVHNKKKYKHIKNFLIIP